ncbi:MAG: hypothetical protein ACI90U_001056 [Pseudomonadales bacterium]
MNDFLVSNSGFQVQIPLSPKNAFTHVHQALGGSELMSPLSENITELVDIF